jgi:3-oxoacyl-[acyl-carrier protein] reductase
VAKRLAADGYQVFITYVSRAQDADAVVAAIQAAGGKARPFLVNVADSEAVTAFFKNEIKDKVRLDVLVNNAGVTKDGLMLRMKDEDFDLVLSVNLRGTFVCTREAAKLMTKQRLGRIVNISSVVGQAGNAGQANYVASKAGVIGLTKTTALELASRGITANAVAPGYIDTDMTSDLPEQVRALFLERIPLKRMGKPEDIAAAVSFLASESAAYITGQVLAVNGGMYM